MSEWKESILIKIKTNIMKDLKQYYCEVTQEQADESIELLVKAGEEVWQDECAFEVYGAEKFIQYDAFDWFVSNSNEMDDKTEITYKEFKQMLIDKDKSPKIKKSDLLKMIEDQQNQINELKRLIKKPQLDEPKVGDWCAFSDFEEDFERGHFIVGKLTEISGKSFEREGKMFWRYARKMPFENPFKK